MRSKALRVIIVILMSAVFLFGLFFTLIPQIQGMIQNKMITEGKSGFEKDLEKVWDKEEQKIVTYVCDDGEEVEIYEYAPEDEEKEIPYPELYAVLKAYNENLYQTGQENFSNSTSYAVQTIKPEDYGIESGIIGTIYIPKINEDLPIYLAATDAHMNKGVAQLTETSMPIGGENTNSVLAAHRQWYGTKFFRDLDKVEIGDYVFITNLWGTLIYRVCEIKIIMPNATEEVLIREGRDMITLITCHPYASGGKYRLAVYCERES